MWDLYQCQDADKAAELFSAKINAVLDNHAPVVTVQIREKLAPWVSNETKLLMSQRESLHSRVVSTQGDNDWASYRSLRNHVSRRVRGEKGEW